MVATRIEEGGKGSCYECRVSVSQDEKVIREMNGGHVNALDTIELYPLKWLR